MATMAGLDALHKRSGAFRPKRSLQSQDVKILPIKGGIGNGSDVVRKVQPRPSFECGAVWGPQVIAPKIMVEYGDAIRDDDPLRQWWVEDHPAMHPSRRILGS
jgi:hypothetical protein